MCDQQNSPLPCQATPGCTWYNGTCRSATATTCGKYTTYETCQNADAGFGLKCAWAAPAAPYQCASYPDGREVALPLSWWMPTPIPHSTFHPTPPPDPWSANLLCYQPRGCMEMGVAGANSGGANAWQATKRPNSCAAYDTAEACPPRTCTWRNDYCVPEPCAEHTTAASCAAAAGCHFTEENFCEQQACSAYTMPEACETAQCQWTGSACQDAAYSCEWETGMCYRDRFRTASPLGGLEPDGHFFPSEGRGFYWTFAPQDIAPGGMCYPPPSSPVPYSSSNMCTWSQPHRDPARCDTAPPTCTPTLMPTKAREACLKQKRTDCSTPTCTPTRAQGRSVCLQNRWCYNCKPYRPTPTPIPNLCSSQDAYNCNEPCTLNQQGQCHLPRLTDASDASDSSPGQYVLELLQQRSQLGEVAPRALVRWTTEEVDSQPVLKYVPDSYPTSSSSCNAIVDIDQNPGGLPRAQAFGSQNGLPLWSPLCQRAENAWKEAARKPTRLSETDPTLALVPGDQYALLTRLATDQWSCSASAEGSHFESYACNFPRYFPVELRYEDAHGLPLGVDAATGKLLDPPAPVQHVSPPPARLGTFERFLPASGPGSQGTPAPCQLTATGDALIHNLSCSCSFTNTAQCKGGGPTSSHTGAPAMYLDRKYPLSCTPSPNLAMSNEDLAQGGGAVALQLAYPKCMAYHLCQLQAQSCNVCQFDRFAYGPYSLVQTPTSCLDEAWAGSPTHSVEAACYDDIDYTSLAKACNVSELEKRLYYSVTYPLGPTQEEVEATLRQWQDVATSQKIWRDAVEGSDSLMEALLPHLPAAFTYGVSQEFQPPWSESTQNASFYPDALKTEKETPTACPAYAITQTCNSLRYTCTAMPTTFSQYNDGELTSYVSSALVHLPLSLARHNKYDSLAWVLGNEDPWGCAHLPSCEYCCGEYPRDCCRTGFCCAEELEVCTGEKKPTGVVEVADDYATTEHEGAGALAGLAVLALL